MNLFSSNLCKTMTAIFSLCVLASGHAEEKMPDIIFPVPGENISINCVSANGNWALTANTLYDLTTTPITPIQMPEGVSARSISDDGNLFVGRHNNTPAIYNRSSGEWTDLTVPQGYSSGSTQNITANGKFVLGSLSPSKGGKSVPAVWNLEDMTVRTANNLPVKDMQNSTTSSVRIRAVSADGRYLSGSMGNQYLLPIYMCSFLYDLDTQTYEIIGFTEKDGEPYPPGDWNYGDPIWEHHHPDLLFIEGATFSSNGKWLTGTAYMRKDTPGVYFSPEYRVAYRMNVETKELEFFDAAGEQDMSGSSVGDDGTLYTYTPAVNPYCYGQVRYENYFFSIDNLLKQVYGFNFEDYGIVNSGKPLSVSRDGRVMVMLNTPDSQYILRLPDPMTEICSAFDMLGNYTVYPDADTKMTAAGLFKLSFDRDIETSGRSTNITLASADGKQTFRPVSSGGLSAFGHDLSIQFRNITLTEGMEYELVIPAGIFWVAGDKSKANKEIRIKYTGRGESPVKFISSSPADGSSIPGIDLVDNPLLLYFDAPVTLSNTSGLKATIRNTEDEDILAELNLFTAKTADKSSVLVSPNGQIKLYKGSDYIINIPEGILTDLSGYGATEEITLHFSGTYVMDPATNGILFSADGSDFVNMFFYDGDQKMPMQEPLEMGFTQDTTPWWVVRDNDDFDMAYASHSMYADHGQADDWMTTNQLYIPDEKVTLEFDSQSYRFDKEDRLKVIVYERNSAIDILTPSIIEDIRENGILIYDEIQSPGKNEDILAGDWHHNVLSLEEFSGKFIYICFLNDNTDQSMIMVDNILVKHDMNIGIELRDDLTVVNRDAFTVRGNLHVFTTTAPYSTVNLTLLDSENTIISELTAEGLSLDTGDTYSFTFPDALPLLKGEGNRFTITARLSGEGVSQVDEGFSDEVKNLTFMPQRRVVLEKYTGRDCGFCPSGIVATELIAERFGENFLPIAIHTYLGDPKGAGMSSYSEFLGCEQLGAPSGRINRGPILSPAYTDQKSQQIIFSKSDCKDGSEPVLWLDQVADLMATAPFLGIVSQVTYADKDKITIKSDITSAIHLNNQNIRIFAVLLEDGLKDYQSNNYAQISDPAISEWCSGGRYGTGRVQDYICNNVARNYWGQSFNGTPSMLPTELYAGSEYPMDFEISVPSYVNDIANCHVTVMLIDGNSGDIINAADASVKTFIDNIRSVSSESEDAEILWYDLQGNRVRDPGHGIFIRVRNGKAAKIII